MKLKYPFEKTTAENLIKNNCSGDNGFYPLGANNFWHGGIHLYSKNDPIRCIADGKVVAYRITKYFLDDTDKNIETRKKFIQQDLKKNKEAYSNSFVLVEHEYTSPKEQKIKFYSLYMHLLPWNLYESRGLKEKDKKLHYFLKNIHTINNTNKDKDGKGLAIVDSNNKVIRVLPCDSLFKIKKTILIKPGKDHWSHQKEHKNTEYKHVRRERDNLIGFCSVSSDYTSKQYDGSYSIDVNGLQIRSFDDYNTILTDRDKSNIRDKLLAFNNNDYGQNLFGEKGFVAAKKDYTLVEIEDCEGKLYTGFVKLDSKKYIYYKKLDQYRLNKATNRNIKWDEPIKDTEGSNIRTKNFTHIAVNQRNSVLKVLPNSTVISFEDEDKYIKFFDKPEKQKKHRYFQLKETEFGDDALVHSSEVETIKHLPEEFDKVVKLKPPLKIEAGEIVGYTGKYKKTVNTFHLEIFTPNIDFWENKPKKGKDETKNTYLIKAATEFKTRKNLKTDVSFQTGNVLALKKNCDKQEQGLRMVEQAHYQFLWVHGNNLLALKEKNGIYRTDLTKGEGVGCEGYKTCSQKGAVLKNDIVKFSIDSDTKLYAFSKEHRGDKGYRHIHVRYDSIEQQSFELAKETLDRQGKNFKNELLHKGKELFVVTESFSTTTYHPDSPVIPNLIESKYDSIRGNTKKVTLKKGSVLFKGKENEIVLWKIAPSLVLWVHRDHLGENYLDEIYTYKTKKTVQGFRECSELGLPDSDGGKYKFTYFSGDKVKRFSNEQRKDRGYFPILAPVEVEDKRKIWFYRNEVSNNSLQYGVVDKKDYYIVKEPLNNFYSKNPGGFLKDTVKNEAALEIGSCGAYKFGKKSWIGFPLSDDKIGWLKDKDAEKYKINYFDWKQFFNKTEEPQGFTNGYCDLPKLIKAIELETEGKNDNLLTTKEIKEAVTDSKIGKDLFKMVCQHPTEWSTKLDKKLKKYDCLHKDLKICKEKEFKLFIQPHIKKLQWWDEASIRELAGKESKLWYFHPVAFIEHFKKINDFGEEFKLLVATIYGEAGLASETAWKAIAHVIMNRVKEKHRGKTTVEEVIKYTGFDAYQHKHAEKQGTGPFQNAMEYLNTNKHGWKYVRSTVDKIKEVVLPIYTGTESDFTKGANFYYSPKAQSILAKQYEAGLISIKYIDPPSHLKNMTKIASFDNGYKLLGSEHKTSTGLPKDDFAFFKG